MKRSEYMKHIRKELGLTQSEMAERLGYSGQKDISRIETGAENMSNQVFAHLKTIEEYVLVPKILKLADKIRETPPDNLKEKRRKDIYRVKRTK